MTRTRRKTRAVTIIDIASSAGVSKSTVSLVLKRSPLVREETRQRVTRAMDALGYVYNRGAASLRRARADVVGMVINDLSNPFFAELAIGIERAASVQDLCRQSDNLSIHCPLTPETKGLIGYDELRLLKKDAVVVNDARGPILDVDALARLMRDEHISAAGLDVLPDEPPVEPIPEFLRAYRAREPWLEGRLVITPHSAWLTPESWIDTRRKSAETMRTALLTNRPQNVITPEMF